MSLSLVTRHKAQGPGGRSGDGEEGKKEQHSMINNKAELNNGSKASLPL